MDPILSRHFAHLWIRDPMTLWKDGVELDDATQSDHFENLQSTNWQTLRFKPPPPNSPIGWRVEFRPMEIQFTEFENAAYSIFIVLVTRVLLRSVLVILISYFGQLTDKSTAFLVDRQSHRRQLSFSSISRSQFAFPSGNNVKSHFLKYYIPRIHFL